MMKQLFEYVILLDEFTTDEKGVKSYKDTKIIVEPKVTLAKEAKDVLFKATREVPDEHASNPDNVRIVVRNF